MKKSLYVLSVILCIVISEKAVSQGSSLIVFTEKGEKFTLFLNGEQKNTTPSDRVTASNLYGPSSKVRVVFRDPSLREINKSIFNKPASDMYYVARPGKKGDYILEHTDYDYIHRGDAVKEETPPPPPDKPATKPVEETETPAKKSSAAGCKTPMSEPDFQASIIMISNAPFEGPKLANAKKMVESHCLTCRQITEVMYIVSYDNSRLSIAKAAYQHCYDPENYDEVKDVLSGTKYKNDLESYIQSVK